MTDVTLALLWLGAVAQTVFVCMWLTLPWWREWIGRALMVKSIALAIFLDQTLVHHYTPEYDAEPYVRLALFGLVIVGIVSQPFALGQEMYRARLGRRNVTGTDHADPHR